MLIESLVKSRLHFIDIYEDDTCLDGSSLSQYSDSDTLSFSQQTFTEQTDLAKWTVSVISSSLRAKMATDLQRYPWNLFLLKYELWTVYSHLWFFLQNWLAHFLFSNGDSHRNIKHVFSQKRFWSAVKVLIRAPLEIRHCHLCMEGHLNITITVPLKGL